MSKLGQSHSEKAVVWMALNSVKKPPWGRKRRGEAVRRYDVVSLIKTGKCFINKKKSKERRERLLSAPDQLQTQFSQTPQSITAHFGKLAQGIASPTSRGLQAVADRFRR